jgi:hypothetical protein
MVKSFLVGLTASVSIASAYAEEEFVEENLPVYCGSLQTVLIGAKEKFKEEPVVTWVDSKLGRYFLLTNEDGSSVTLLLVVEGIKDGACVVSFGDQFMQAPKKPTL